MQREVEMSARITALTRELVAAAAATGQTEMPQLLQSTTEELISLQAAHRELQSRCEVAEDRATQAEGDARRAATTIVKLQAELRDERKKRDKLLQNLYAQREAEAAAAAEIQALQGQLGGSLGAGASAAHGHVHHHNHASAGAAVNNPSSLTRPSFMRSLSTSLATAPPGTPAGGPPPR